VRFLHDGEIYFSNCEKSPRHAEKRISAPFDKQRSLHNRRPAARPRDPESLNAALDPADKPRDDEFFDLCRDLCLIRGANCGLGRPFSVVYFLLFMYNFCLLQYMKKTPCVSSSSKTTKKRFLIFTKG